MSVRMSTRGKRTPKLIQTRKTRKTKKTRKTRKTKKNEKNENENENEIGRTTDVRSANCIHQSFYARMTQGRKSNKSKYFHQIDGQTDVASLMNAKKRISGSYSHDNVLSFGGCPWWNDDDYYYYCQRGGGSRYLLLKYF